MGSGSVLGGSAALGDFFNIQFTNGSAGKFKVKDSDGKK